MVEIPGMDMFRYDRDNGHVNGTVKLRGGGISCYIRKELKLNVSICSKGRHQNSLSVTTDKPQRMTNVGD